MARNPFRLPPLTPAAGGARAGRQKQRSGADFQRQVEAANAFYRHKGLALVEDIPTATVHRRGQLQYAGKRGKVDYIGLVKDHHHTTALFPSLSGAVPLAFDAKVVDGRTFAPAHWSDPKHRDRLARQVDFLLDWCRFGGIGGYLCFEREGGRLYWLHASYLIPFTGPRALAGEMPEVVIREIDRKTKDLHTPHPWCHVAPDAAVVTGWAPAIRWRDLALAATPSPLHPGWDRRK